MTLGLWGLAYTELGIHAQQLSLSANLPALRVPDAN
jgi:hypothetical protein